MAYLKEFRNILLGHQITVYTDHKNLTYNLFYSERVICWRLILEEFGPELKYIKGKNNVVADALCRLGMSDNQDILSISELYGYNDADLTDSAYPIRYCNIPKAQKTDAKINQKLVSHKDYTLNNFFRDDQNHCLIFRNSKICLPEALQKKTVDWYHKMLCHPVETYTEHALHQHLDWKGLHTTVHNVCKKCQSFQREKQLIRNMASFHLNRPKKT